MPRPFAVGLMARKHFTLNKIQPIKSQVPEGQKKIMAHQIYYNEHENVTIYNSDRPDNCGNPRNIVHFADFLTDEEYDALNVLSAYELVAKKIKKFARLTWRRYNCREFGGGFICQGDYCDGHKTAEDVLRIRNRQQY